ncbi:FtsX-like permease family protein [Paenibacillus sp. FSL H7-0737]|uniref:ABC transporter permease n=1 Tax=Paenibacillus sp. FSL H7-0737 TaxID=1536775 RepID=UPI0004F70CC2|nr:ABC transporter permease [Paenibacillus sp. FSL H7-0737]AIQ23878.1 cell division protein FtsX [Paenibacillus sp. FSL H7-0737]
MNIVNKLTLRHLKQNKRRTLVTIIGVIISVAMVTAVATLGFSFMELMRQQSISTNGEWHVQYRNVTKAQLKAIEADDATKTLVISNDRGYAPLEGGQNENKPYWYIKEYNLAGFKQFPIELLDGRLPKTNYEVVISEEIAKNAKVTYKIGETLTLDVGERVTRDDKNSGQPLSQNERLRTEEDTLNEEIIHKKPMNYTIVGVIKRPTWEPTWSPGYTALSYVDESLIGAAEKTTATVVLNKVDSSIYKHAEELAQENNIESISYNNSLLRYYGVTNNDGLRNTLLSLSVIVMTVIIIGSVSLIYNAFAISVSERARHLGMLSSVGATKRQKQNSVFFEGMIIGLISIPIGILCGITGIGITFMFINSMIQDVLGITEKLTLVVTPLSLLTACVVSIMTIFISTYLPARKASKISAIDAIRQSTDVKLSGKAVKTSKFVRKLFGIEAEIGLKNLKRNKRRYQATVFSLVISIVLFLSVSSFTSNMRKSVELSQDGLNYDIQVYMGTEDAQKVAQLTKSISALPNITEYNVVRELSLSSWIDEKDMAKELQEIVEKDSSILKNGKYPYYIQIHALNDQSLRTYAESVGVSYEQLTDLNQMSAIVNDTVTFEDENAKKIIETKALHSEIGQKLDLIYTDWNTEKETKLPPVEIVALTDKRPMGVHSAQVGGLNIIVSDQVFDQLTNDTMSNDIQSRLNLNSSDPLATQQAIEEMKERNIYVQNVYQNRQNSEQMIMLMSIFTYGFIALITLISIANIFNTISTSISLRKREFAMLKSVGMTPNGFNKMINYESVFYGIKSLLYGLPISIVIMYLIYRSMMSSFSYGFTLPWMSILYVIVAVFIIVSSAMLYSSSKVKKENIIDALKQENI